MDGHTLERSCGAVVVQKRPTGYYYLLVQHQRGLHWGLPKGHVDPNESREQTALREVLEETGLKIKLIDGFRRKVSYTIQAGVRKEVWYYLGTTSSQRLVLPPDEIRHAVWLELADAVRLVSHRNTAKVLREAHEWLHEVPARLARVREAR